MKQMNLICEAKLNLTEKAANGEPTGKIEARITTWGPREGADGRRFNYRPEGFMDWAKEFASSGRPLPMHVNHNSDAIPVGEWTSIEMDDEGMSASGRLFLNTTAGSDLYQVMSESPNMFGGVSVGAYADEYQMVNADGEPDQSENAYFQITKGGLREVSVVMYPNNPNAEISKLEAFDAEGHLNPRILEKALREAGISKKDATTASSIFKKIIESRDASKVDENSPNQSDSDAVAKEAKDLLIALELRELSKALDKRIK